MQKMIFLLKKLITNVMCRFRLYLYEIHGNIISNDVIIGKNSKIYKSKFGSYSACNSGCIIVNCDIGNYTNIAWNVTIGPRSHIYTNFTVNDFVYNFQEVVEISNIGMFEGYFNKIGSDVWIGCNVIILPGVEIGNGAIIAAGSVVNKSIPPYAIIGGNPAVFIKWRFDENVIRNLELLKWYDWSIKDVISKKDALETIACFDIAAFKYNYQTRRNDVCVEAKGL